MFLGDCVDEGAEVARTIETIRLLRSRELDSVVCLMGNREAALLRAMHDPRRAAAWTATGGDRTLASYGAAVFDRTAPGPVAFLQSRIDWSWRPDDEPGVSSRAQGLPAKRHDLGPVAEHRPSWVPGPAFGEPRDDIGEGFRWRKRARIPAPQRYAAAIPRKSSAFRLAPPTSAPSTFSTASSVAAFSPVTEPP